MSCIDDQITDFFNHMASVRWDLEDSEKWLRDYEKNRYGYPDWVTENGVHIKIYELTDSHLANLIPFVEREDPENKTKWIDLLRAEKRYRELIKKIQKMKEKLANMEHVSNVCL